MLATFCKNTLHFHPKSLVDPLSDNDLVDPLSDNDLVVPLSDNDLCIPVHGIMLSDSDLLHLLVQFPLDAIEVVLLLFIPYIPAAK